MPTPNWNRTWLNSNAQRAYPLTDWASKEDVTETVKIPDSFIVAFYLPVHAGLDVDPEKFFLRSLLIRGGGYTLEFAYDDGTLAPPIVAQVGVESATHEENKTYAVIGVNDFDDTVGRIAIGRLTEINRLPPGRFLFAYEDGAIEVDCIRPMIRGLQSITVVNGEDRSPKLYGDVELVAGENFRITVSQVGDAPAQIAFSAIDGEGLNEECVCDVTEGPPIRTINGVPPLPNGNFRLIGDDCITVTGITNGLQLSDACSKPCCKCDKLSDLQSRLNELVDGVATLQGFTNRVATEVSAMSSTLLGSRLNDNGCINCG